MSRIERKQSAGRTTGGRRRKYRLNWKRFLGVLVTFGLAMGFFLALFTANVVANAPKIDSTNIYSYLTEASVLYDQDGKVIENVFTENGNRVNVTYDELPQDLVDAIVAIEDKTFWTHNGFNVVRIFGAIWEGITTGDQISGTSTITQQLARNVYLADIRNVRSLNRKITEAYYTMMLESSLTKKEILEAYLNTIAMGYNCYGVQSAAQAYFSKDVKDLSLLECAALAAIPKANGDYALIKRIDKTSTEDTGPIDEDLILSETTDYMLVYNGDASKSRRDLVLKFMAQQGYISAEERDAALALDLRDSIDPALDSLTGLSAYFCDYVIAEVIDDLMAEYGYDEAQAKEMLYRGGLKIYTTMDAHAQEAIETAFANTDNFPSVANLRRDSQKNLLDAKGKILLINYDNYFDADENFRLKSTDYTMDADGNMTLLKGQRLNLYKTTVNGATDYSIEFKPIYIYKDGVFYTLQGGYLMVPQQYKTQDADGNVVIDASFFEDYPNFFVKDGSTYIVPRQGDVPDQGITINNYVLKQQVRQPQAAMVITDYHTGQIKAMAGGRSTTGRMLYNRAIAPRQPGSAIKPLTVYSAALQQGLLAVEKGTPMTFGEFDENQKTKLYGEYWTAASIINDAKLVVQGKTWPKNWYSGYRGLMTMRTAVEQSVNVCAARVFQQVGTTFAISQLEKFGVTTAITDKSAAVNDVNIAALALGGMSRGISPLEMSSAFGTFPNKGEYVEPIAYTKITNKNGEVLINKTSKKQQVVDPGVAFIMTDILRTTVSNGIAHGATTGNQPVGGKTGTTTDNFDAWFCGFTPQYSAALWIGNDVNIELSLGSPAAAKLWGKIMKEVCAGMDGSFPSAPDNVIKSDVSGESEYYISGTETGVQPMPQKVTVTVCAETGYLATPWCYETKSLSTTSDEVFATFYCFQHNLDPTQYPIDPTQTWNDQFVWIDPNDPGNNGNGNGNGG